MDTHDFVYRERPKRTIGPKNRIALWVAAGVAAAAVIVGATAGVVTATDTPTFCNAACHEMRPYHAAWAQGSHKNVPCVACHVDSSPIAHVTHKVEALGQLRDHLFGSPKFPRATAPDVPNERCVRCHPNVVVNRPGFSHAAHAARKPCQSCHSTVGHVVAPASLQAEGVFDPAAEASQSLKRVSVVGNGSSNLAGHVTVECSNCHIMASTKCSSCHQAPHAPRGECSTCHATGAKFVFTHPSGPQAATCQNCHQPPAKPAHTWPASACTVCHNKPGVAWTFLHPQAKPEQCATCHARPAKHRQGNCTRCHKMGESWKFIHPAATADCESCHQRPSGHPSGVCTKCHAQPGVAWTFNHPSNGANCQSCHSRPSGHRSGTCTTCHQTGSKWIFRHPTGSPNCASCHQRPSGHRSGTCATCHRNPGVSWAFTHPTGKPNCANCHKPPANHFKSGCQQCHSHSAGWANPHFTHPSNTGAHTYRSFACVKCHPSGYASHYCSCHGSNNGPGD